LHVAVLTVLAETGLRVGELCALTTADVELRPRKGRVVREGKGGRYREVPLNAEARRALRAYLEVRPAVEVSPNPYLASTIFSGVILPRSVRSKSPSKLTNATPYFSAATY